MQLYKSVSIIWIWLIITKAAVVFRDGECKNMMKRHWLLILQYISNPTPSTFWNHPHMELFTQNYLVKRGFPAVCSISFTTGCSCSSGTSKVHHQHQLQYVSPFPLGDSWCLLCNFAQVQNIKCTVSKIISNLYRFIRALISAFDNKPIYTWNRKWVHF